MERDSWEIIFGALLHDIGKVVMRSGRDVEAHPKAGENFLSKYTKNDVILKSARYHHYKDFYGSRLHENHPAYIVYIADNIAAGSDRRECENDTLGGFNKRVALDSIFNLLFNNQKKRKLPLTEIEKTYPKAEDEREISEFEYSKVLSKFEDGLVGIQFEPEYINSVLELLEACFSYVPSSTNNKEVPDISLYDHMKITAAIACCITQYCKEQGIDNYKHVLFENAGEFYKNEAFCLCSVDISGIQDFIYQIASKSALKNLRTRSFYLEFILENIADEVIEACDVTRANLLYTGGGHAYWLLPNTKAAKECFVKTIGNINEGMAKHFGTMLYIAHGYAPCSANVLMSEDEDKAAYVKLFQSVASEISKQKLHRYNCSEIVKFNDDDSDIKMRECKICGRANIEEEEEDTCFECRQFIDYSKTLLEPEAVFIVIKKHTLIEKGLPIWDKEGNELSMTITNQEHARNMLKNENDIVRIYSKNLFRTGYTIASKLWMGDYAARDENNNIKSFEDMAQEANGVKRIAVLRMDVDNLGTAFTRGFIRENIEDRYRYLTLSRTAAFSRNMSIFFKYYINEILNDSKFSLRTTKRTNNTCLVYSGGDDLFLVGSWDEVFCAAIDIQNAFKAYTGGILTLSAGLAVFPNGYPLAAMARETGELEEISKEFKYANGEKNAISLFGTEYYKNGIVCKHTYSWEVMQKEIVGEKLKLLDELFKERTDLGHGFIYKLVDLLREAEENKLNLARLAYLLARRDDKKVSESAKCMYKQFTQEVYKWALNEGQRKQLLTALLIFVYTSRGMKEDK